MKKLFAICPFLLSISFQAQNVLDLKTMNYVKEGASTIPTRDIDCSLDGVTVTYHFRNIAIYSDPLYKNASTVDIGGFWPNHGVGEPAILYKWDTFIVPNENATVSLIDADFIELPLELSPARPVLNNSSYEVFSKDNVKPIKEYEGFYPLNPLPITRNDEYRHKKLLDVCICPIQYDYANKKARIYTKIKYILNYNTTINKRAVFADNKRFSENNFLLNNVLNSSFFFSDKIEYQSKSATQQINSHYLIITIPKYLTAVKRFAEWKRTLGFDVHVAVNTTWTAAAVKDTVVNDYYSNNTEYLLIVGGHNDVPAEIKNLRHQHVTDLYYGCIGSNDTIYTPSIYRGRILVNTAVEANTVINKIINNEKLPPTIPSMYNRGVNCAFFQDVDYNNYEDRRFTLTSERIRNHLLQQGKIVNRVYYAQNDVWPTNWNYGIFAYGESIPIELLKPNFKWNGDSIDIANIINQKAFYALYRGHGDEESWIDMGYNINGINDLNNGNALPVVFSISCLTGKFNESNCFCEAFLKKYNGGCSAIFGATERSLSGPNDVMSEGMFDAIWPSDSLHTYIPSADSILTSAPIPTYRLGQILDQGLRRVNEAYMNTNTTYDRYTHELFHCFGDPSMMIYTETPTTFTNASITRSNGTIYVNTGGETATITYYNRRTGSIASFIGTSHSYANDPETSVCISAHNKIPYIDFGTLYIQNQTLTESDDFESNNIKVGNNVTPYQTQGDVRFQNGHYTLKGKKVELQSGTQINYGASIMVNSF